MEENIQIILDHLILPFYKTFEFWLFITVGVLGLIFAFLAFNEAKKAKKAAMAAGTTVKIQTVTIELTEIRQKLGKLDTGISYAEARDLLNDVTGKLRRLISAFKNEIDLKDTISSVLSSLEEAKKALETVRPIVGEADIQGVESNSVYNATESHFSNISGCVADLMGLFERRAIDFGYTSE